MPNVSQLIRNVTQSKRVQQYIVEKDYALSYLLAAIATTDGLGENLVLKGGSALRKLYFPEYRFSEDPDYSTREIGSIQQIDAFLNLICMGVTLWLQPTDKLAKHSPMTWGGRQDPAVRQ